MSVMYVQGRAEHYPAKNVFEFDSEVATIFPDMARRSIPMYEEVHRMHVSLFRSVLSKPGVVVYDVGSSRGQFFDEVCNQFQNTRMQAGAEVPKFYAVDTSIKMLELIRESMPWVRTIEADVRKMQEMPEKADMVVMLYVLQFMQHASDKLAALRWAYRQMSPGAVLLLGQKERINPEYEEDFTSEYHAFRRANGYTQQEIDRKTEALRHSMWPIAAGELSLLCEEAGFSQYQETSRWLQFSTGFCIKR